VGVDQRNGGIWQLEVAVEMVERVRKAEEGGKQVAFILSRLEPLILRRYKNTNTAV
jgi:hypothetical protein